jgi:hypothetical protein
MFPYLREHVSFLVSFSKCDNWPDKGWDDTPPPVENIAAQGQLQHLQFADMGRYTRITILLSKTIPWLLWMSLLRHRPPHYFP